MRPAALISAFWEHLELLKSKDGMIKVNDKQTTNSYSAEHLAFLVFPYILPNYDNFNLV